MSRLALSLLCALALACEDPADPARDAAPSPQDAGADRAPAGDAAPDAALDARPDARPDAAPDRGLPTIPAQVAVRVLLDDAPAPGVRVTQGGTDRVAFTDATGQIPAFALDLDVVGDVVLVASHPEARQRTAWIYEGFEGPAEILLARYGPDDPTYRFQDPGEPARRNNTAQCGHCHLRINDAWYASPHRTAARNPKVHDLYSGTASGRGAAACAEAGGRWLEGRLPGGGQGLRCFLGDGALATVNPGCAPPCDAPVDTAGCADCHAPAQDGALGGRDLLTATDLAYRYGVSCDVCHRVDAVVPEAPPGVAGRLRLTRPSDPGPRGLGAGGRLPLTFGPSHDSPNPRMGGVQRDHYRDGSLCQGCHEYHHGALVPGDALDPARWPTGQLPIQTTYSEWSASVYGGKVPCNACHMPPDPIASNGADLQEFPLAEIGVQGGWQRPPGSVRRHSWDGPRQPESRLLELSVGLDLRLRPAPDGLWADVAVTNLGAGHALPTGEPMRHLLLVVDARCGDAPLPATGGDALPDYAGHADLKDPDGDWDRWPGAALGDRIRVVRRPGGWRADPGPPPFGDWPPEQRGLPIEEVAGEATVTAVGPDGALSLDAPLPPGDRAYRIPAAAPEALAGAAGHAFARVTRDAAGRRMIPHFRANDLASDNRLPPLATTTTAHRFEPPAGCAPRVRARLLYRDAPWALARERAWVLRDALMAEVSR